MAAESAAANRGKRHKDAAPEPLGAGEALEAWREELSENSRHGVYSRTLMPRAFILR